MPAPFVKSAPPTAGLSRPVLRGALRVWTIEAAVASVQITLTQGAFQTGFALYLGCNPFWIGVLAAISPLAALMQLLSADICRRIGSRKLIVSWASVISRTLWLPMLLIPFVLPRGAWVGVFLLLTLVSSVMINVSNPLWTAWISDLVPPDNRGRYFARRNMWFQLVGTVVSIVGGVFLDGATKRHEYSIPMAFGVVFATATLFGIGSFLCASSSPDIPDAPGQGAAKDPDSGINGLDRFLTPLRDTNFRPILILSAAIVVSQNIAGPFFTVYQISYLALDYTALQLLSAVASLASLASVPLLGYLADKYGNKPVMGLSLALVILPPVLWILASPDGIAGLWAVQHHALRISWTKVDIVFLNLMSGVGWAGVGLAQFNLLIGGASSERRTAYVGAVSAISGVLGALAPLLGGVIVQTLSVVHFPSHWLVHNGFHVLFILTCGTRVMCLLLLRPVQERGSASARYFLGQLKASKPVGSFASIQKLAKGSTAQVRQQAAEELARLKTPVAVEELVKALDDVALPVREQAAVALGEIGDSRALAPLLDKLTDPASGIEGPAATALGKIGDRAALPSLAAAARLGPLPRQLAAIEALGRFSDSRATDVLIEVLGLPDLYVPVLRALGDREDPAALPTLVERLGVEEESAALAILADAVGRFGDPTALPGLVAALSRTQSRTVRREILNAIGSVIGGRDSFYPYLAMDEDARDETATKTLINIEKRLRVQARRGGGMPSARRAVRARQALTAFAADDMQGALHRLAQLAMIPPTYETDREGLAVSALAELDRAVRAMAQPPEPEDTMLAVFLTRLLTDARAPVTVPPDG